MGRAIGIANAIGFRTGSKVNQTLEAILTASGDGSGVARFEIEVSDEVVFTLIGDANFYDDEIATVGESKAWTLVPGAIRQKYLKSTGSATIKISDRSKILTIGDVGLDGWVSGSNAPELSIDISKIPNLNLIRVTGRSNLTGSFSPKLTYIRIIGETITLNNSSPAPAGLTLFQLIGSNINWTGLSIDGSETITSLVLTNFRTSKMSSPDMVTLLTSLTNRSGGLPSTISINDYADYANPPQSVVDAVALLKSTKNVTTVNLGA